MLLLAAVALAATGVVGLGGSGESATDLASRAITSTEHDPACRFVLTPRASTPSDHPPLSQITGLLPGLAVARRPSAELLRLATTAAHAPVLETTIREVEFAGGIRILLFVTEGFGPVAPADPQGCLTARLTYLAALRPKRDDPTREAAAARIREDPETSRGEESLFIDVLAHGPGPARLSGGSALPVTPAGAQLRSGLTQSLSGCGSVATQSGPGCPVLYAGIAAPGAKRVTVVPEHRAQAHGVALRVPIDQGLFAFALRRGTGPERVSSVSSTGAVLQTQTIRLG
jgi:hypothetical protein